MLPADNPAQVLRHKQASSMGQALAQVRDGVAQACVSAGNTGGLVMLAAHMLGMNQGCQPPSAVYCCAYGSWLYLAAGLGRRVNARCGLFG